MGQLAILRASSIVKIGGREGLGRKGVVKEDTPNSRAVKQDNSFMFNDWVCLKMLLLRMLILIYVSCLKLSLYANSQYPHGESANGLAMHLSIIGMNASACLNATGLGMLKRNN